MVLRHYEMSDLDALWEAIEVERDRLGEWMPFVRDAKPSMTSERGSSRSRPNHVDSVAEACGEAPSSSAELDCSRTPSGSFAEIGYWVRREYEGRGYVTRACRALIGIGFGELGLHRIVIRAGTDNARSRSVPERLGFTYEGIAREEGRGSGGFYDLAVYGCSDREWRS